MITRTDILAHLERNARGGFLAAMKAYTPLRAPFCGQTPSDGPFEIYADLGAVPWPGQNGGQGGSQGTDGRIGAEQTSGLHEGGPITVLGGNERSIVVYNDDWNIPIGVWHNAINDGKASLEQWARNAGNRFQQHQDYLAFAALNGGDGTTYGKCYDGLYFFSNSHVDKNAQYTTVQDNLNGLALSLDNFETVRVAAAAFKDDRGQPCGFDHSLLVHSVNLERVAAQIVSNREAYDTANREMNPYAGKITGLRAPGGYVDSTFWAIVDPSQPQKPINIQLRQAPELVFWDDHTQGNGVRYYKWVARYTVFYGDWRLASMGNS
jgi:hypothetical protein